MSIAAWGGGGGVRWKGWWVGENSVEGTGVQPEIGCEIA